MLRRETQRQHGLEQVRLGVVEAQILARLLDHREAALVIDLGGIDGAGRHHAGDPEGGAGLGLGGWSRSAGAGRRAGRVGTAAGGHDRTEQRNRDADDRASAQELPTAEVARDELVDNVVLEFASVTTKLVEFFSVPLHDHLFLSGRRAGAQLVNLLHMAGRVSRADVTPVSLTGNGYPNSISVRAPCPASISPNASLIRRSG